jgi:hypothetical protein
MIFSFLIMLHQLSHEVLDEKREFDLETVEGREMHIYERSM